MRTHHSTLDALRSMNGTVNEADITKAIEVLAEAQLTADEATAIEEELGPGPGLDTSVAHALLERAREALADIEHVADGSELLRRALTALEFARMARDHLRRLRAP